MSRRRTCFGGLKDDVSSNPDGAWRGLRLQFESHAEVPGRRWKTDSGRALRAVFRKDAADRALAVHAPGQEREEVPRKTRRQPVRSCGNTMRERP